MATRKTIVLTTAIVCLAAVVSFCGLNYMMNLQKYKNAIKSISIKNIDLSKISDGTYLGSYDALMIKADVSVVIRNHKITDIKLLQHKNERGKNAEVIPQRVLEAQSLYVDTVSGATNSSKVILKAIENALEIRK